MVTAPQCHSVLWMVSVRETNMGRRAEHKFLEHVRQLAYLLFYRALYVTPRTPCYIGIYTSFGIERCIVFRSPVTQWPMSCVTLNPTVVDASICLPYKLCNCDGATRLIIDNLHHLAFQVAASFTTWVIMLCFKSCLSEASTTSCHNCSTIFVKTGSFANPLLYIYWIRNLVYSRWV